jgi:chromosome transmission fidelity protein 1
MAVDLAEERLDEDTYLPDEGCEDNQDNFSPAVRALMEKSVKICSFETRLMLIDRMNKNNKCNPHSEEAESSCTKIYYASRTHSQLSQLLPELSKLKFSHFALDNVVQDKNTAANTSPPARDASGQKKRTAADVDDGQCEADHRQWRTVPLGSRKQLCINEDARSSQGNLDENCRELLEGAGAVNSRASIDRCWIHFQGNKINVVNICHQWEMTHACST